MKTGRSFLPAGFWKGFGPGLLWAAAAIGVSHLVQATRAGAVAGFGLTGVIVLALILKYPFFEYGPRYAAATGSSLVEGYRRIGKWALWLYFLLTLVTSVIVQGAVVLFTAFLLQYILQTSLPITWVAAGMMALCGAVLWLGRFRTLDLVIKIVLVVLAISTLFAAVLAIPRADFTTFAFVPDIGGGAVSLAFILALAGWMPSALDIAVWNSLWTLAKDRTVGERASVETALLDFRIGYVGTSILAFAFLLLGAAVMYGAGRDFSAAGTVFSTQLVELYSETVGAWLKPIVLVAVFATMFSTTLTVVDGFPRSLDRCIQNLGRAEDIGSEALTIGRWYWWSLIAIAVTTFVVLTVFLGSLTAMVDFATIFTFLTAPVLGYLNLRAITAPEVAPEHRPGRMLLTVSYVGLAVLGGTALVYIGSRVL